MTDIDNFMQKFCDAGARALERYALISGEECWYAPEYFMPALILHQLGEETPITLETNFSKLVKLNSEIRIRRNLPPHSEEKTKQLLALAEGFGNPRVDMVLYETRNGGEQWKENLEYLAIVEFKKDDASI